MFPISDTRHSGKFPLVTFILIITNLYIFFLELLSFDLESFIDRFSLIPANVDITKPETLTPFITSMFLHAGFLHIGSNMWFLWIFGDNVEAAIGHLKYFFFYIFSGIAAMFIQYIFIADSSLPMLGASGAIAGILGAYLRFFPANRINTIIPIFGLPAIIAIPASFTLIYWFVIQAFNGVATIFIATASIGGVAYLAHAGGFVFGFILSKSFASQKKYYNG